MKLMLLGVLNWTILYHYCNEGQTKFTFLCTNIQSHLSRMGTNHLLAIKYVKKVNLYFITKLKRALVWIGLFRSFIMWQNYKRKFIEAFYVWIVLKPFVELLRAMLTISIESYFMRLLLRFFCVWIGLTNGAFIQNLKLDGKELRIQIIGELFNLT